MTKESRNPYTEGSYAATGWDRGWTAALRGNTGPGFMPSNGRYWVEGFKACLDSAPIDHMTNRADRSADWEHGYAIGFHDAKDPAKCATGGSSYGRGRDFNFGYANGRQRGYALAQARQSMRDYHTPPAEWQMGEVCETLSDGTTVRYTTEVHQYEPADQKEQAMDSQEAITLIQLTGGASIVKCVYVDSHHADAEAKGYHFKNVVGLELAVDDIIVVESRAAFALVKVVEVDVMPDELACSFSALKHVVQKVDFGPLHAVHKQERKAKYKLGMSAVSSRLDKYREQLGKEGFGDLRGLLASPKAQRFTPTEPDPRSWAAEDTIEGDVAEVMDAPGDGGSDGFGEA